MKSFDNMKTVVNHAKSSFAQTVFNDRFEHLQRIWVHPCSLPAIQTSDER